MHIRFFTTPMVALTILCGSLFGASPRTADAGPPCVTKSGWHYAISEDVLDMAGKFVQQGDKVAFGKLIATGKLHPMKAGIPVYLDPGGGFGHAAIRLPGALGHVWVLNEAIKCGP